MLQWPGAAKVGLQSPAVRLGVAAAPAIRALSYYFLRTSTRCVAHEMHGSYARAIVSRMALGSPL